MNLYWSRLHGMMMLVLERPDDEGINGADGNNQQQHAQRAPWLILEVDIETQPGIPSHP